MTSEKWIENLFDGNEYPENVEREEWDKIKEFAKIDAVFRKTLEEWIKISVEHGGDSE